MKFWGLAAMVLLIGVSSDVLGGNYDGMLEDGMTYRQVVQMLDGDPGEKIDEFFFGGQKMEIYRWGNDLVRGFMNGKLQHPAILKGWAFLGLGTKGKKSSLDKFQEPESLPADKDVTAEKFEAVKVDMTSEDVFKILGTTNIHAKKFTNDTVAKYKEISFYQWFNEFSRGSVNVIFLDNEVVGKGEVGLYPSGSVPTDLSGILKVGMKSENVAAILGKNVKCRKYINKIMVKNPDTINLCRWWIDTGKINVIFLNDMVIGTWNYQK